MQKVFHGQGALFKSWSCQLLNKRLLVKRNLVVRAGLYVKENLFIVHTSKESYQGIGEGKLDRLCGALSQGKLVQLYTRAIKTCQGKLLRKKTCSSYTRARKAAKELVKENLIVCAWLLSAAPKCCKIE